MLHTNSEQKIEHAKSIAWSGRSRCLQGWKLTATKLQLTCVSYLKVHRKARLLHVMALHRIPLQLERPTRPDCFQNSRCKKTSGSDSDSTRMSNLPWKSAFECCVFQLVEILVRTCAMKQEENYLPMVTYHTFWTDADYLVGKNLPVYTSSYNHWPVFMLYDVQYGASETGIIRVVPAWEICMI